MHARVLLWRRRVCLLVRARAQNRAQHTGRAKMRTTHRARKNVHNTHTHTHTHTHTPQVNFAAVRFMRVLARVVLTMRYTDVAQKEGSRGSLKERLGQFRKEYSAMLYGSEVGELLTTWRLVRQFGRIINVCIQCCHAAHVDMKQCVIGDLDAIPTTAHACTRVYTHTHAHTHTSLRITGCTQ